MVMVVLLSLDMLIPSEKIFQVCFRGSKYLLRRCLDV